MPKYALVQLPLMFQTAFFIIFACISFEVAFVILEKGIVTNVSYI